MKRTMAVGLMVALTGLLACNKDSGSGGSTGNAGGGGGGGVESIGVKECDDYMKEWQDCYKDPATKAAMKPGLEQMVTAWKQAAATPQGKSGLAMTCKASADALKSSGACK